MTYIKTVVSAHVGKDPCWYCEFNNGPHHQCPSYPAIILELALLSEDSDDKLDELELDELEEELLDDELLDELEELDELDDELLDELDDKLLLDALDSDETELLDEELLELLLLDELTDDELLEDEDELLELTLLELDTLELLLLLDDSLEDELLLPLLLDDDDVSHSSSPESTNHQGICRSLGSPIRPVPAPTAGDVVSSVKTHGWLTNMGSPCKPLASTPNACSSDSVVACAPVLYHRYSSPAPLPLK